MSDPKQAAFLEELSTAHPYATMLQKPKLTGDLDKITKKIYVLATGFDPISFPQFAESFPSQGRPGEELETHRFTMHSVLKETAEVLIRRAA